MKKIFVDDVGKGYPLILVHGYLGSSEMWRHQKKYFSNFCRVIAPALPGFGESFETKSLNSINKMANTILEIIKEKKIKKFNLMGHSMGGMIVQEMAKKAKDNISKLICYSTGPRGQMPGRFETVDQSRENLKKKGLETLVKNIVKTWFIKKEEAKYFKKCIEVGKLTSVEAADNAFIAFKNWNGVDSLKNIKNKTLIVWGDQDKSYGINEIELLKKNILNSSLVIFKGCAHNVHLEKVDEFNNKILNFLRDN